MDRLGAKGMKEQSERMIPLGKMGTKREYHNLHTSYHILKAVGRYPS